MQEKRKSPRAPAVQLVSFAEYSAEHVLELLGIGASRDVSEGGLLVETPFTLPVGARAAVEFVVDGDTVRADAEVVRAEVEGSRCRLAFRFLGFPTEQDQDRVRRFVESRRKGPPPPPELGVQVGKPRPPASTPTQPAAEAEGAGQPAAAASPEAKPERTRDSGRAKKAASGKKKKTARKAAKSKATSSSGRSGKSTDEKKTTRKKTAKKKSAKKKTAKKKTSKKKSATSGARKTKKSGSRSGRQNRSSDAGG